MIIHKQISHKDTEFKNIKKLLFIAFIFISYLLIYNYHKPFLLDIQSLRGIKYNFLIPFLLSVWFWFLVKKKYTYIAISLYLVFCLMIISEQLNYQYLVRQTVVAYAAFIIFISFVLISIHQILSKFKIEKIAIIINMFITFLIYSIPLVSIIYVLNFNSPILKETIYAIFQSNQQEASEYIFDFVAIHYILLFALVIIVINFLIYRQHKSQPLSVKAVYLIGAMIIFGGISLPKLDKFQIYNLVISGNKDYKKELKLFKETLNKIQTKKIKYSANKIEKGETYIVVIGESLNKEHMGIYGYFRKTTPLLSEMEDKEGLMVFHQTYANHTHTIETLGLALTEANQYNNKKYYDSLTIVDILKKANVETYWITNQALYGIYDNLVSIIAKTSQHLISLNKSVGSSNTQKYDDAIIDEIKTILAQKTKKNRVIFVHLMGNHGRYSLRYPREKYGVYSSKIKQGEFGKKPLSNKVNHYDNSVIYNDFVVASILKELQKKSKNQASALLYFADHADDVIGNKGHGSQQFNYHMIQTPMLLWLSDDYQTKYPAKYATLKANTHNVYTNDMIYNTLIGVTNIKTDKYNPEYDLASKKYKINVKNALTLHGKKRYADSDNYIFWQQYNADYLLKTNQATRIFPHRVNSIGKLQDIWNDGFRSFELDVIFEHSKDNIFQVGHNQGDMGLDFYNFLSRSEHSKIERIWLDFKNLNLENHKRALDRLNKLDQQYQLKDKIILESSTKLPFFKTFKDSGWHTSYYLPTSLIVKLLKENNQSEMQKISKQMIKQIKLQALSAISFDDRLYPFVKQYIEPYINKNIVYHMWLAPALSDKEFKRKLLQNKLYLDKRIKTLLTPYKSQFNL